MRSTRYVIFLAAFLSARVFAAPCAVSEAVPFNLPGASGAFDFMAADAVNDRVLAAHRGAGKLEVLELASGNALPAVAVGAAQGVAVDSTHHRYFAGTEAEKSVVAVDSATMKVVGERKVSGPVDAVEYDGKRNRVYAAEDDGKRLWILDGTSLKPLGEIAIPGVPEVMQFDPGTGFLFLNIKDKNLVVRIDPDKKKVTASWPTAPAVSPHGLAIDVKMRRLFSAGGNGTLVELDLATGKVLASARIAPHVDQIAYDPECQTVFSAGKGALSLTATSKDALESLPDVPSPPGAHTLAVDAKRHDVWMSYSTPEGSRLLKFAHK